MRERRQSNPGPAVTIIEITFASQKVHPDQRAARLDRDLTDWHHRFADLRLRAALFQHPVITVETQFFRAATGLNFPPATTGVHREYGTRLAGT
jgi:hypothetical protein